MKNLSGAWLVNMTIALAIALAIGHVAERLTAQPSVTLHLTQLSSREWVDLSTVSMIRLPVYLASIPGCPDCQLRYGANIISGGVAWDYSEAAEPAVRKLLGTAVAADMRRTYREMLTCNEIARDGCLAEQK